MAELPDLPVDDTSLDLYWAALHPGPEAGRSSIGDVLDLYSQMAGSDPHAEDGQIRDQYGDVIDGIVVRRDCFYHPNDLISALIVEIRRLRAAHRSGWDAVPRRLGGTDG